VFSYNSSINFNTWKSNVEGILLLSILILKCFSIFSLYYPVVMERLRMLSSLVHPLEKSTAAFASVILGVIEATVHCAAEVTNHSKVSER